MRINTNISAMNTHASMVRADNAISKSLERLSSGLRINRAADDAAGLAISEKMRSQIRGLQQASRNAQDGISLIQTAEGALNETHSILQRMRELAVQAANETLTDQDRVEIQREIDQLTAEVDRIGETTEFNTKKLLNGGAGLQTSFTSETVAGVSTDWLSVIGGTADTKIGSLNITAATKATGASATLTVAATAGQQSFSINGRTLTYTATGTADTDGAALVDLINANTDILGATASYDSATDALTITNISVGSASRLTISAAAGAIQVGATNVDTIGTDATITESTIGTNYIANGNTITVTGGNFKGLQLKFNGDVMSVTANQNLAQFSITANGVLSLQIGANEGQEMSVSIGDMRASALGVNNVSVLSKDLAAATITTIDDAVKAVSAERAKLGAYQNRLEHTISNLGTASENLTASESRIRDVDMAEEMANFSRAQILMQASTAMMAQANQKPQAVLKLLG